MNVEKIDTLIIDVKNLEEGMKKYSDILGTTFHNFGEMPFHKAIPEGADKGYERTRIRFAIDRRGFVELVESIPPVEQEGVRGIHYKVPDIEEAKEEMKLKGYKLVADIRNGNLKEAIFEPDELCGVRLILIEYKEASMVDAILSGATERGH